MSKPLLPPGVSKITSAVSPKAIASAASSGAASVQALRERVDPQQTLREGMSNLRERMDPQNLREGLLSNLRDSMDPLDLFQRFVAEMCCCCSNSDN